MPDHVSAWLPRSDARDMPPTAPPRGGLNMLTRVMGAEWGPFNVQTIAVAPTVVLTDTGKKPAVTRRRAHP